MLVVHVLVQVKPESVEAFRLATLENARESIRETGVVRFDVLQQVDDPSRFVLVEIFRDKDAPARHKQTEHYARWRDAVEPLMAAPRSSVRYGAVFPEPDRWELPE